MRRTQTQTAAQQRKRLALVILGILVLMLLCANYWYLGGAKRTWVLPTETPTGSGLARFFGFDDDDDGNDGNEDDDGGNFSPAPLGRIQSLYRKKRVPHITSLLEVNAKDIVSKTFYSSALLNDIKLWINVIVASSLHGALPNHDSSADELHYIADCWNDPDWFRMNGDPICTYLWLRELQHGRVRYLDRILGVIPRSMIKQMQESHKDMYIKAAQNGGMRCIFENLLLNPTFDHRIEDENLLPSPSTRQDNENDKGEDGEEDGGDGRGLAAGKEEMNAMTSLRRMALEAKAIRLDPNIMGYWKPCNGNVAGNSENYHAEIVAFIIDRIVGFYRTPAVAPYTFEGFDLDRLANLAQDKGPLGAAQLYENPTLHDSEAIFKIDTVTSYCGRPANVPGRPARDSFGSMGRP